MILKKIKVAHIKPYWRNPRINDKSVDALVESIKLYGYAQPIIVDKKNVIVAGHTRHKAVSRLGMEEVDCIVFEGTEKQAKEYRVIDNKVAEMSEWDMKLLIPELREFDSLKDMTEFFPDFKFEELVANSVGNGIFNDVTQQQIDDKQTLLDGKFKKLSDERNEDKVEVICPHCTESFWLEKKEMK